LLVFSLLFLHGAIVIDEHEGVGVFGIGIALSALVSGT